MKVYCLLITEGRVLSFMACHYATAWSNIFFKRFDAVLSYLFKGILTEDKVRLCQCSGVEGYMSFLLSLSHVAKCMHTAMLDAVLRKVVLGSLSSGPSSSRGKSACLSHPSHVLSSSNRTPLAPQAWSPDCLKKDVTIAISYCLGC